MDAQQMHDLRMQEQGKPDQSASKAKLKALLRDKNGSSLEPSRSTALDPIAQAMANNPSLTREKAEQMAEDLGF